jgi:hypothetical protein
MIGAAIAQDRITAKLGGPHERRVSGHRHTIVIIAPVERSTDHSPSQ